MENEIVNRVANSGLITIDLEDYHHPAERVLLDISDQLFQGLILREKDFREYIATHNWQQYSGKNIAICCTADAIVPTWAFMLLCTALEPHANKVVFGSLQTLEETLYKEAISQIDINTFANQRVVIKGCSNKPVPTFAYVAITELLRPVVRSIMYGEPCSTVPIYKKARE